MNQDESNSFENDISKYNSVRSETQTDINIFNMENHFDWMENHIV